jgi:fumarylacetoacetate (FAA) hydrolase
MKLATQQDGTRDGRLVVVSRDLRQTIAATRIAPTLQDALERWAEVEAPLRHLSAMLDAGDAPDAEDFAADRMMAPLPRAWQWLDGSAFTTHGDLMQKAFGLPPIETDRPLMYQGMSHRFLAGHEDVPLPDTADGIDFEGEFGVIVGDVPMGAGLDQAEASIALIVLINDWSLRAIAPVEMKTGFGWIQAKPACSLAPVAVTIDELGTAWHDGRVALPLTVSRNGETFGSPSGAAMAVGFPDLIVHAARTRDLPAGTIIGSGTVSNANHAEVGSCCISERRAIEMIAHGGATTPFLGFGECVSMICHDRAGTSLFGEINQKVIQASSRVRP